MLSAEQRQYIETLRQRYPDIPEATLRSTLEGAGWTPAVIAEGVNLYKGNVATPSQPVAQQSAAPSRPVQTPIPQTATPTASPSTPAAQPSPKQPSASSSVRLDDNLARKKSPAIGVLLAIGGGVLVVVIALYFMFSGGSKKTPSPAAPAASTKTTPSPTPPPATKPVTPAAVPVAKDLVATTYKDSVLRSLNGGDTFDTYFTIATTSKIGLADVLSVAFHPKVKDRVVVTTYQDGLFFNQGRVNSWTPVAFPPKRIYSFILDKKNPDNRIFASGVVDNDGRIFRTSDAGVAWRAVYAEPGVGTYISSLAQDPVNPDVILAGTNSGTLVKSADGGDTWRNVGQNINGNISTLTYDATRQEFVYLLTYQAAVYHSFDGGLTWENWETVKQQEIRDLSKQAGVYASQKNQAMVKQTNNQIQQLIALNNTEHIPGGINLIVPDPTRSGVIYAGTSGGLYRSVDYGKYWTKLNIIESAEGFPIRSIAINPKNSNEIVFVSGKSFYKSKNYGDTWETVPLDNARNASFVAYDPFDPKVIFIGMSSI